MAGKTVIVSMELLLHVDIVDHKLWIQHDGTEEGIANVRNCAVEALVKIGSPQPLSHLLHQIPDLVRVFRYLVFSGDRAR